MRVRFCLICVKTVTPLPFHWQPLFPLRAWAVTSLLRRGCAPEPWAKAKLKFWREEVLRRGVSSHPPPCPGSPDGDGQGEPLLRLRRARRTQGHPTNPLTLVLKDPCGPQMGGSVWIHHPATPETSGVHCSRRTLAEVLRSAVPCQAGQTAGVPRRLQELRSSPLKARTMKTLCWCCTCQHYKARQKWPRWRRRGEKKLHVCSCEQAEPNISCTQMNKQLFGNLCRAAVRETFFCHKIHVF